MSNITVTGSLIHKFIVIADCNHKALTSKFPYLKPWSHRLNFVRAFLEW